LFGCNNVSPEKDISTPLSQKLGSYCTFNVGIKTTPYDVQLAQQTAFTFSDNNGMNSLFSVIGFDKGNSYTSSGNALTAIYPFNFYNITRLNIKSSTFNLKNVDSNNRGQTRTICSVPVNANQYGGMVYYNNFSHYKSIFKNDHLQNITI
jgi:hypothetical protein